MQLKKWGIYLACCLRRNRGHHGGESLVTGAWDRWSHRVSSQEAEREQRVGQAYSVSKPTPSDRLPSMFHHVTSSWSYITFQNSATSRDQVFKYVRLWGTFQMKIITQLLYASCKHTYFVCAWETVLLPSYLLLHLDLTSAVTNSRLLPSSPLHNTPRFFCCCSLNKDKGSLKRHSIGYLWGYWGTERGCQRKA